MTPGADFDEFFSAHWARLVRTTIPVAGDLHRAEDAVQAAFVKAHSSWRRVQGASDPFAYVRRIAINAALADARKAFRRREVLAEPVGEEILHARDEMWAAVLQLPPRQRAVLALRYYEDLTEREIAAVLAIRPGTVKSTASAGLAALRSKLKEGDPA